MIAESEMQTAVLTLLQADSTLAGIAKGIFDLNAIPATQAFPYVVLGETTMAPYDVFAGNGISGNGQELTLAIHTWSRYSGKKELATMRGLIYNALHGKSLSMAHYTGTMVFDSGNAMEDDTASIKLLHGTDRYRIKAEEKAS